jgi:hypothetical protein
MTTITFDTLKFVERLKHSGTSKKKAKGILDAYRHAREEMESTKKTGFISKTDLQQFEYRITIKLGLMLTIAMALFMILQKIL